MKIQAISPTRISLFGGGTDVDPYVSLYRGICINMAISLRTKVTMYSDNDIFERPDNIFPTNADPNLFYTIFKKYGIDGGHITKIKSEFDGRIGAGLGSSASACVALIGTINKRKQLGMKLEDIAKSAWEAEEYLMGWHGGKQDQWAAAYGGLSVLTFENYIVTAPSKVRRVELSSYYANEICKYLLLFDTGGTRASHKVQQGFINLTEEQTQKLHSIKESAQKAFAAIMHEDFMSLGELLHESWLLKKKSNKGISTKRINELYTAARDNGAEGGKILGAGGCGYMAFWVPPNQQDTVVAHMEKEGCEHIIYYPDTRGLEIKEEKKGGELYE